MDNRLFVVARDDWSLHRKGEIDQERHKRKVKEAIRQNLADVVSEESIIMSEGERVVKVPIRSLDEPRLRYDTGDQPQVGQGQGGTQVGDVIGQGDPGQGQQAAGPGKGQGPAGEDAGVDYYEAELTIDELAELVFEDLSLPRLKPKSAPDLTVEDTRFDDVRKQGMMSNVDKRRTLLEAVKRQALGGSPTAGSGISAFSDSSTESASAYGLSALSQSAPPAAIGPILGEDLRYKTWDEIRKPQSSAVVLAMMDTSGSMGTFEKYAARSFFFWMVRFLRTRYDDVRIRFLAHSTEAKEVGENDFFSKGESGGTKCSSVYRLALHLLETEHPAAACNAYAFHFSDGDNLSSDNSETVKLAEELLSRVNLLGYGEIRKHLYADQQLWNSFARLDPSPAFVRSILKEKEDVFKTLKAFFGEELAS